MIRGKNILFMGDEHFPAHHPSIFSFARKVVKDYKIDTVILMGDLMDQYAFSTHEKDVDEDNARREMDETKRAVKKYLKCFKGLPVHWVTGNHDDRIKRIANKASLPSWVLRPLSELLEVNINPVDSLYIMSGGKRIYATHNPGSSILKLIERRNECCIGAHLHVKAGIHFSANEDKLIWGVHNPCFIDKDHPFMRYASQSQKLAKPIIGCTVSLNGVPMIIPAKL